MSSRLNDPRDPWSRLTAAARTVRDDRDASAPYGFATRVAALAFSQERTVGSLLDVFALRALGVACLVALVSVAMNYGTLTSVVTPSNAVAEADPVMLPADDAVAIVLDLVAD